MEEDISMTGKPGHPNLTTLDALTEGSDAVANFLTILEKDFENVVPAGGSDVESGNQTTWVMPPEMKFNDAHVISIVVYSTLMVFSAVGNVTVLVTIMRLRCKGQRSRVNLFLLHLAVADLLVTFLLMPLEIAWNWTVSWTAGDGLCRVMAFFRTFGLYLSGFLLICISLDRYFAVVKPLDLNGAVERSRQMLITAWIGSGICSVPQALVFHVERHPKAAWFEQCVTFHSFPSPELELLYIAFGFIFLYAFPFVVIVVCYLCILRKICTVDEQDVADRLRRSNTETLSRAKTRALKLTITIVATFCLCWTPYNTIALWYMIDRSSAQQLDQRIQKGLFLFACTNSCFNPLVYGYFHFKKRRVVRACNPHRTKLQEIPAGCRLRVRWGLSERLRDEQHKVGAEADLLPTTNHGHLQESTQLKVAMVGGHMLKSSRQQETHPAIVLEPRTLGQTSTLSQ